tara:strand:- start:112 stop:531 length:420 start_codon:yes stop_codon:yes gene_type:complete
VNSSISKYDFDEEGLLMSENLTIETNKLEYHNRGLQAIVLPSLYVLAVWVPEICFVLYSFLVRGVSSNDLIYALFIMITFMASPDAVLIQWEALIFTVTLLAGIVFVWPESLKGKTWCAGLVLLLHGAVGGYLIYLRTR